MNIHAHENKLAFLEKELERLTKLHKKGLDPDGILVSDAGVVSLIKKKCPWLPIHISTQANTLNSAAIEHWAKQGVERVVLGREVSLRELKKIRKTLKQKRIKVEATVDYLSGQVSKEGMVTIPRTGITARAEERAEEFPWWIIILIIGIVLLYIYWRRR